VLLTTYPLIRPRSFRQYLQVYRVTIFGSPTRVRTGYLLHASQMLCHNVNLRGVPSSILRRSSSGVVDSKFIFM